MFKYWNKSLSVGLLFTLLGLAYFAGSFNIGKTHLERVIGAEFVPRVYVSVLFICAFVELYRGIKQYLEDHAKDKQAQPIRWDGLKNVAIAFIAIFLYVCLLETLGFLLCSFLLIMVLCVLMTPGYKKPNYRNYLLLAVILPLVALFIFKYMMYMPLPIGTVFGG